MLDRENLPPFLTIPPRPNTRLLPHRPPLDVRVANSLSRAELAGLFCLAIAIGFCWGVYFAS
jgi:hypothetical protein